LPKLTARPIVKPEIRPKSPILPFKNHGKRAHQRDRTLLKYPVNGPPSGPVWFGPVWFGLVRSGSVQSGSVWFGLVRSGSVWLS
jgi:hypothetical protein